MGLAEAIVLSGDRVCIVFGCSTLVILWKINNHYIYISDACVVDYMHGKGMEELENGKFQGVISAESLPPFLPTQLFTIAALLKRYSSSPHHSA
jgi:hypothetical protein